MARSRPAPLEEEACLGLLPVSVLKRLPFLDGRHSESTSTMRAFSSTPSTVNQGWMKVTYMVSASPPIVYGLSVVAAIEEVAFMLNVQ